MWLVLLSLGIVLPFTAAQTVPDTAPPAADTAPPAPGTAPPAPPATTATTPEEDAPFQVQGCEKDDACSCLITGSWTKQQEYDELVALSYRMNVVEETLSSLNIAALVGRINNVTGRIVGLEERVEGQTVSINIQEIISLKKNVEIMADLLDLLEMENSSSAHVQKLKEELDELGVVVEQLWNRNPEAGGPDLQAEIAALRARLQYAQGHVGTYNTTYFQGDKLPANHKDEGWCEKHVLRGVGDAVTHRWITGWPYGSWLKDPYPVTEKNKTQIYYRPHSGAYNFLRHENYTDFITNRNQEIVYPGLHVEGLGFVVYKGSVYVPYSQHIYRYLLDRKTNIKSPLTYQTTNYLANTLGTYVDLKVDEKGLWAVYATKENSGKMVISRLNPSTLNIEESWPTNKRKTSACAAFMVCGRLHVIDSCTARLSPGQHHKQYIFDTTTAKEEYQNMHISSKYGHIWELTYNPREKMLFGWDAGHMVTYPLNWAETGA